MKNPVGICLCGCRLEAPLSPETRRGHTRGEPVQYIRGHYRKALKGPCFKVDSNDCWIWQGNISPSTGYGRYHDEAAHRIFFRSFKGDIPKGKEVHHLCEVKTCVNPDHLVAVTRRAHMNTDGRFAFGNKKALVHATH